MPFDGYDSQRPWSIFHSRHSGISLFGIYKGLTTSSMHPKAQEVFYIIAPATPLKTAYYILELPKYVPRLWGQFEGAQDWKLESERKHSQ
jgi:hypothetical protein